MDRGKLESASAHRRPQWTRALRLTKNCRITFQIDHAEIEILDARVEKSFGISMDTLMRMQNNYNIAQARSREGEIKVKRYEPKPKDAAQPK